jgi:hypothetical protein
VSSCALRNGFALSQCRRERRIIAQHQDSSHARSCRWIPDQRRAARAEHESMCRIDIEKRGRREVRYHPQPRKRHPSSHRCSGHLAVNPRSRAAAARRHHGSRPEGQKGDRKYCDRASSITSFSGREQGAVCASHIAEHHPSSSVYDSQ